MRRTMLAGFALALTVAGADAALAQQTPRERPSAEGRQERMERRGPGPAMARLFKGIELTTDQKTKLQELRKQGRPERNQEAFKQQREKIRVAREAGDTAQLRQLRADMMKRAQAEQQQYFAQVRSILNESQRAQFDRNVAEMREQMQKRRVEHGARGGAGKEHRGHGAKPQTGNR